MQTATTKQAAFSLKSTPTQLTVMALQSNDIDAITAQARDMTEKMPQFFEHLPIVLDCTALLSDDLAVESLLAKLRACSLYPVGFRGASDRLAMHAKACGLAPISAGTKPAATQNTPAPEPIAEPKSALAQNTRIIHTPVRSGQQIYASGGDLVVIGTVSAGAEVIADGNIHIYGKLRGKALAGAKGNPDARIFCADMQAELISIAGIYRLEEDISKRHLNVCVWLEEEILQMMEMPL